MYINISYISYISYKTYLSYMYDLYHVVSYCLTIAAVCQHHPSGAGGVSAVYCGSRQAHQTGGPWWGPVM